jgi:hypothetical protein
MVTAEPSGKVAPGAGAVMADVGGVASVDADASVMPDIGEKGWTFPMSASRFTVACCMAGSVEVPVHELSSPHDHCTVPASKTSAPLAAR